MFDDDDNDIQNFSTEEEISSPRSADKKKMAIKIPHLGDLDKLKYSYVVIAILTLVIGKLIIDNKSTEKYFAEQEEVQREAIERKRNSLQSAIDESNASKDISKKLSDNFDEKNKQYQNCEERLEDQVTMYEGEIDSHIKEKSFLKYTLNNTEKDLSKLKQTLQASKIIKPAGKLSAIENNKQTNKLLQLISRQMSNQGMKALTNQQLKMIGDQLKKQVLYKFDIKQLKSAAVKITAQIKKSIDIHKRSIASKQMALKNEQQHRASIKLTARPSSKSLIKVIRPQTRRQRIPMHQLTKMYQDFNKAKKLYKKRGPKAKVKHTFHSQHKQKSTSGLPRTIGVAYEYNDKVSEMKDLN